MARRAADGDSGVAWGAGGDADGDSRESLSVVIEDGAGSGGEGIADALRGAGDAIQGTLGIGGGGDPEPAPRRRRGRQPKAAATATPPREVEGSSGNGIARTIKQGFRFLGHQGHKTFGPGQLYGAAAFWEYDRDELAIVEGLSTAAFKGADFEDAPQKVALIGLGVFAVITIGLRAWQTQQLVRAVQQQAMMQQQMQAQGMAPAPAGFAPPRSAESPSEPAEGAYSQERRRTDFADLMSELQAAG